MNMDVPVCPCRDCRYHSYDCHSNCFKYNEWQQLHEVHKMFLDEQRKKNREIYLYKRGRRSAYEHNKNRKRRT